MVLWLATILRSAAPGGNTGSERAGRGRQNENPENSESA
jgi:hypothetical protein